MPWSLGRRTTVFLVVCGDQRNCRKAGRDGSGGAVALPGNISGVTLLGSGAGTNSNPNLTVYTLHRDDILPPNHWHLGLVVQWTTFLNFSGPALSPLPKSRWAFTPVVDLADRK